MKTIDSKGRVRDIEVIESVPPGVFDRERVRALKNFRYKSSPSNPERIPIRIKFRMDLELVK